MSQEPTAARIDSSTSDRAAIAIIVAFAAATVLEHWLVGNRYGFQRDELQTLDDARHFAWGCVAYPSLTPLVGRLSLILFGTSLRGFRFFASLALAAALLISGLMARQLGGRRGAQVLTAFAVMPVWRDVMLRLTGEFRCVAFDAPGTGQSARVPLRALTLHRASRVLVGVIRSLDLRDLTLVCHDLGGLSGIVGAVEVADRVRGLCAVNTFAWPPAGRFLRGMLTLMGNSVVRELDAVTGLLPQITASKFGVGRHLDDPSRNAFLAAIGRQGVRSFHGYMHDARYSSIGEEAEAALRGPLRRVAVMTVFGERNDSFGFQRRWRQTIPRLPPNRRPWRKPFPDV